MATELARSDIDQLEKMATPARFARYTSKAITGYQWEPAPHLLYMEKQILGAIKNTSEQSFLRINLPPRHGKEIRITEPILTVDGWSTMGELEIGDEVFDPWGQPTKVVWKSPVNHSSPKLRVELTDGRRLDVHPRHEWTVYDRGSREWRRMETQAIASRRYWSAGRAVLQLPFSEAINLPDVTLPLDPYYLGVWLGDGSARGAELTLGPADAAEIVERLASRGVVPSACNVHPVTGVPRYGFAGGPRTVLRSLGLLNDKQIPEMYALAGIGQRRALLAGLVDSDGHVNKQGRVVFVNRDERLARQVVALVRSLGYFPNIQRRVDQREAHLVNGHEVKTAGVDWAVDWTPHDGQGQGWLARKQVPTKGTRRMPGIRSITPASEADGVCIQVGSDNGLFLAGRDLIPTHNSQLCSLFLPAWILGMFPEKRVILVTYSDDFSAQWGARVRNLLKMFGKELFGVTVDKSNQATAEWSMENSFGGMTSAGIGGGITGKGADVLIMDDLIKNAEEAASPTTKKKQFEEYLGTIRPRLEPGGTMISIHTRWAEDDMSGMIEAASSEFSDRWESIVFPAVCEPPEGWKGDEDTYRDMIGRKVGDPLWPQRWTLEQLLRIKALNDTTPATWDSLYQQRPTPRGGNMFPPEAWQFFDSADTRTLMDGCHSMIRMWDLASSQDAGDYTVGLLMGVDYRNRFFVFDVKRFRKHPSGIEQTIIETAEQDGRNVKIRFEQERSGAGAIIVSNYKRVLPSNDVDGRKPIGTKENRAGVFASKVVNQMIWLPRDAPWTQDYIDEHRRFPRGRYDDQVDTGVYAYDELAVLNGGSQIWTPHALLRTVEGGVPSLIESGFLSPR